MDSMSEKSKRSVTLPKFGGPRPDFNKPPVTEVVLSLQFDPIQGFDVPHFGLLWDRYRKNFPDVSTKSPLPPVFETYGSPQSNQIVRFQLTQDPEIPRCWFESVKGTELIQVQADRFIFNWKSEDGSEPYPRYEKVRSRFEKYFKVFEKFLRENELGKVKPNQCEVTYVNEIVPGDGWKRLGQIGRVFSFWSGRFSDKFLREPNEIYFRFSNQMASAEGEPIGKLHVSADPRYRIGDGAPLIRLVITARGAPQNQTKKAVIDFFDIGREYIVRGFASLTTKEMHKLWERTDV